MKINIYSSKAVKMTIFSKIALFYFFFTSCSVLGPAEDPLNENYNANLDLKHGYERFGDDNGIGSVWDNYFSNDSPEFKENILWNVALDKISFMPIQSSDQQSGVITTEWFQAGDDLNNRIKLVIYIKDNEVEDDSIDVKVFKETFDGKKWNTTKSNNNLALKIKKSILDSSKDLYIANQMS